MVLKQKKGSLIDRRLKDLHKELKRVDQDLKKVTRINPASAWPPRSKTFPGAAEAVAAVAKQPADDLFAHAADSTTITKTEDLTADPISNAATASLTTHHQRTGREKFAHYFMAGHFPNLHPPRQEHRIVRNKAILMLLALALLLTWLLYYLRSH